MYSARRDLKLQRTQSIKREEDGSALGNSSNEKGHNAERRVTKTTFSVSNGSSEKLIRGSKNRCPSVNNVGKNSCKEFL